MKTAYTFLTLAVVLLVANSLFAADPVKKDVGKPSVLYYRTIDRLLSPVTLSDDQKTKLEGLKSDYESKFKDAYAKRNVLTPEQTKLANDARKAAKAAGKTGKDVTAAIDAAVKLTDEQQKQEKEGKKQLLALQKEFKAKVVDLLTADQKTQIDEAKSKKPDKPAKSNKVDKPAETDKPATESAPVDAGK